VPSEHRYDVIVVGAGNAGLTAAMSAAEHGASVLMLERAPEYLRGGNTYFTGGLFRFAYEGLDDVLKLAPGVPRDQRASMDVGAYTQAGYYADVMRLSEGLSDPDLVQMLVSQSLPTMKWMMEKGVAWIPAFGRQSFKSGGGSKFWGGLVLEAVGGGNDLSDRLFQLAGRGGAAVRYGTRATDLLTDRRGRVRGVTVRDGDGYRDVAAGSVVLASGGFEANSEMRARYLGPGWELAKVRGTRFNTGDGITMALSAGAQPYGHWSGCHAIAWDLNAPPFGDRRIGDLHQKHSYPFGLIVNVDGRRFVDEGADFRNYTYARYGKEILYQPHRSAFQLFDEKTRPLLRDEYWIPEASKVEATNIKGLAEGLGIDRDGLVSTVAEFNEAVQEGPFDPTALDGKRTLGLQPPKSNWALPLDTPPYLGYAVTCGITFTFGGLKVNTRAQVLDTEDVPIPGLYAAGELLGGLFYNNYPGGAGLMAGAVFGRTAGASAAIGSTTV